VVNVSVAMRDAKRENRKRVFPVLATPARVRFLSVFSSRGDPPGAPRESGRAKTETAVLVSA